MRRFKLFLKILSVCALIFAALASVYYNILYYCPDLLGGSFSYPTMEITSLSDAELVNATLESDHMVVSTTSDSRLIFYGINIPVHDVTLVIDNAVTPHNTAQVYINTGNGFNFNESLIAHAGIGENHFIMNAGHMPVLDLRVDPTSVKSREVSIAKIIINQEPDMPKSAIVFACDLIFLLFINLVYTRHFKIPYRIALIVFCAAILFKLNYTLLLVNRPRRSTLMIAVLGLFLIIITLFRKERSRVETASYIR